jgi:hypothetical protein
MPQSRKPNEQNEERTEDKAEERFEARNPQNSEVKPSVQDQWKSSEVRVARFDVEENDQKIEKTQKRVNDPAINNEKSWSRAREEPINSKKGETKSQGQDATHFQSFTHEEDATNDHDRKPKVPTEITSISKAQQTPMSKTQQTNFELTHANLSCKVSTKNSSKKRADRQPEVEQAPAKPEKKPVHMKDRIQQTPSEKTVQTEPIKPNLASKINILISTANESTQTIPAKKILAEKPDTISRNQNELKLHIQTSQKPPKVASFQRIQPFLMHHSRSFIKISSDHQRVVCSSKPDLHPCRGILKDSLKTKHSCPLKPNAKCKLPLIKPWQSTASSRADRPVEFGAPLRKLMGKTGGQKLKLQVHDRDGMRHQKHYLRKFDANTPAVNRPDRPDSRVVEAKSFRFFGKQKGETCERDSVRITQDFQRDTQDTFAQNRSSKKSYEPKVVSFRVGDQEEDKGIFEIFTNESIKNRDSENSKQTMTGPLQFQIKTDREIQLSKSKSTSRVKKPAKSVKKKKAKKGNIVIVDNNIEPCRIKVESRSPSGEQHKPIEIDIVNKQKKPKRTKKTIPEPSRVHIVPALQLNRLQTSLPYKRKPDKSSSIIVEGGHMKIHTQEQLSVQNASTNRGVQLVFAPNTERPGSYLRLETNKKEKLRRPLVLEINEKRGAGVSRLANSSGSTINLYNSTVKSKMQKSYQETTPVQLQLSARGRHSYSVKGGDIRISSERIDIM